MKLRTRLLASFFIILGIPIVAACLGLFVFSKVETKHLEKEYNFEGNVGFISGFAIQLLADMSQSDYDNIKALVDNSPKLLYDEDYLGLKNDELNLRESFLILRNGEEIAFWGGPAENSIPGLLKSYEKEGSDIMYADETASALIRKLDFKGVKGENMSIFMVTEINHILPGLQNFMSEYVMVLLFALIFTALLFIIWNYQGVTSPVAKLSRAMKNIEEGNLDFELKPESDDEIGDLTKQFDEMRIRLKANMEEKLNAESENRILINNITHDLKTPITSIKGYVEGIMDGVADTPEKMDRYIRTIYNKANEMDKLINELTAYANIDTNRTPYNFNKISVADYFGDCVEEFKLDLEDKGIRLTYNNYVSEDAVIIIDPEQLHRVLSNIIGNACKYMDRSKDEKIINIRINDEDDFIRVEVEDNGLGIAKADIEHIFDRFYRADESRNSTTGGSGIGLSIVKKIIEDHAGRVWVTSKPGIGTIIYFVIRKYKEGSDE